MTLAMFAEFLFPTVSLILIISVLLVGLCPKSKSGATNDCTVLFVAPRNAFSIMPRLPCSLAMSRSIIQLLTCLGAGLFINNS